jgi:hypothetical protein
MSALYAYSLLTRAALGDRRRTSRSWRLFRIQMSTKALSSIVPGGSAAGSALGYRLMTLSGVPGPDAGFALATAGLGSAVVLNLLFWVALVVSIPIRGVNGGYASAAIAGVIVMGFVAHTRVRPARRPGSGRADRCAGSRASCASTRTVPRPACATSRGGWRSSPPTGNCSAA